MLELLLFGIWNLEFEIPDQEERRRAATRPRDGARGQPYRALATRSAGVGSGAVNDLRNASTCRRSWGLSLKKFWVIRLASPACRATAWSSVSARPSWRYGPESRNPHRGGVRHSNRDAGPLEGRLSELGPAWPGWPNGAAADWTNATSAWTATAT